MVDRLMIRKDLQAAVMAHLIGIHCAVAIDVLARTIGVMSANDVLSTKLRLSPELYDNAAAVLHAS